MRKSIRYALAGGVLVGAIATGSLAYAYPITAAVACPSCYGMEYAGPRLIVDRAMPAEQRKELSRDAERAASTVRAFYGAFALRPFIVACSTADCDRRMGGRGSRAVTLSTPVATFLRVSPQGIDPTILTHEFSHVELHRRIGLWAQLSGAFPAWFDEGVAVLVSADARYLRPGTTAAERCARNDEGPLPTTPFDWSSKAGKDHTLYADAVCRVLRWMEENGGKDGLLKTLDAVAHGVPFTPNDGRQGSGARSRTSQTS